MNNISKNRPLSPHLSIYKPQITSMMSICHRATGVFNAIGLIMIVMWISSVGAEKTSCYDWFMDLATSFLGQLFILGWIFSIYYHLCNGIRHLFWDFGYGFKIENVTKSGLAVLTTSSLLTLITVIGVL